MIKRFILCVQSPRHYNNPRSSHAVDFCYSVLDDPIPSPFHITCPFAPSRIPIGILIETTEDSGMLVTGRLFFGRSCVTSGGSRKSTGRGGNSMGLKEVCYIHSKFLKFIIIFIIIIMIIIIFLFFLGGGGGGSGRVHRFATSYI